MTNAPGCVAVVNGKEKVAAGRYIYAITTAWSGGPELGDIGIDNARVRAIPYRNICAIVHDCAAEPYDSRDEKQVRAWLETHHSVVETIQKQTRTVIPLVFDTIIQSHEGAPDPEQVVKDWLQDDYENLVMTMEKIDGKDEYGVKICLDPAYSGKIVTQESAVLKQITGEIAGKPPGIAYLLRQKLEKATRAETERLADRLSADFFNAIRKHLADVRIEKTGGKDNGKLVVLKISCLVEKSRVEELGQELEKINYREGFSVHFSGPWPAYSFVAKSPRMTGEN
jgi:hypothetical protein